VYNASLNSINNTPLANQTLIFSVNGINYTRTTNLDGIVFLNINLNDGIYSISTIFKDVRGNELINTNKIYVCHTEGTLIKDNLSGSEIQRIIDSANADDTLIFAGDTYRDVSITVNKPLNIISIVKSQLIGNSKSPVIRVNSDNVNISNFVISSGSEGVLLDNANNVKISFNDIINNYRGIYLKDSSNTNISGNTIKDNYDGIYFDRNVVGTQIFSNYMTGSENNAVYFAKSGSHTNMTYNILEYNENGIFFDMVGDEDINIQYNTIQRNNDNGINFGENYRKTDEENGVLAIGNNAIIYNRGFNILARDSAYNSIKIGDNYVASDNPRFNKVCERIKFNKFTMTVSQINGNTLSVTVNGIKTDAMLRVSYNGGKNWKTVSLVNGQATLDISNEDGRVVFDYFAEENDNYEYQMVDYVPPTPSPVTPTNPDNTNPSESTNPSGNSQSEKTEGNGTSTNPSSGSSQPQSNVANSNTPIEDASSQSVESSSSQAASQAVSSDGASQSESKESVAKVLSIDEEVVRIAGLSFIVLLIIAVIGLYYKDDIEYMLNKRNGH
jgi:parallel beta-helix repeat protein